MECMRAFNLSPETVGSGNLIGFPICTCEGMDPADVGGLREDKSSVVSTCKFAFVW
jgi:hypothetical protein